MTDERYKELMERVGMPNSRSLLLALQQVANEVAQEMQSRFQGCQCNECKKAPHDSDCAVHNEPAEPKGACDCRSEWVSVDDRLPDVGTDAWAFRPDATFDPCRITKYKKDGFSCIYRVTHWQPLPSPPTNNRD